MKGTSAEEYTDPFQSLVDEKYNKLVSTPRVLKHRHEAAKQGRKRKEYLISDTEHIKLKAYLKELRA